MCAISCKNYRLLSFMVASYDPYLLTVRGIFAFSYEALHSVETDVAFHLRTDSLEAG